MLVQITNLPKFLKNSKFYENLDSNDDEFITIPNLKIDDEILNFEDFKYLIGTLDFFDCHKYPKNFIKYYKNNSQEVFDFLKNDVFKNELMLKKFCGLRIKNYKQFFVTYKIISLYKLNPEDYNYYIDYALDKENEFITDEGYLIDDYGYAGLAIEISTTKILELRPDYILDGEIYLYSSIKILKKYISKSIKGVSIIPIECFDKIFNAIKYDYAYDYNHNQPRKRYPAYRGNKLYLLLNTSKGESILSTIEITEFNRHNVLKEFEKVIKWISEESKNSEEF
uniref:Uncharacterized protein n=1 Tax=viral metagenome TaxID=1070528 RepID=A0A6C0ACX3_9ZZZZ